VLAQGAGMAAAAAAEPTAGTDDASRDGADDA
jgi:hypothetical protein